MNKLTYSLLAGFISMVGSSVLVYAAEEHAKEATQHLEQAVESAKKGDTAGAVIHDEEAKKHVIKENADKPYIEPAKQISGENPKAEHDKAALGEIAKSERHAKKGHAKAAADAAEKAEVHLQKKEQSK